MKRLTVKICILLSLLTASQRTCESSGDSRLIEQALGKGSGLTQQFLQSHAAMQARGTVEDADITQTMTPLFANKDVGGLCRFLSSFGGKKRSDLTITVYLNAARHGYFEMLGENPLCKFLDVHNDPGLDSLEQANVFNDMVESAIANYGRFLHNYEQYRGENQDSWKKTFNLLTTGKRFKATLGIDTRSGQPYLVKAMRQGLDPESISLLINNTDLSRASKDGPSDPGMASQKWGELFVLATRIFCQEDDAAEIMFSLEFAKFSEDSAVRLLKKTKDDHSMAAASEYLKGDGCNHQGARNAGDIERLRKKLIETIEKAYKNQ